MKLWESLKDVYLDYHAVVMMEFAMVFWWESLWDSQKDVCLVDEMVDLMANLKDVDKVAVKAVRTVDLMAN